MNTATHPLANAGRRLLGILLSSTTFLFRRNRTSAALAGTFAGELRAKPELAAWVLSLARESRALRSASLLRTASTLRRESRTFEAADALKRMASRPAIFRAVLRELHGPIVLSSI
jgi:hypothetical protein